MGERQRSRLPRKPVLAALFGLFLIAAHHPPPAHAVEAAALRGESQAHEAEGDRLFRFLAMARTEADARAVEDEIWRHWMLAPNAEAGELMARAMDRRRNFDLAGGVAVLDELIALAPDWAEAWNQRATLRFMQGAFEASLTDIEETLQREPRHFGAMAGMAIILTRQGRVRLAQTTLRAAVAIHPYLRERSMIVSIPGKDI
jgi:tetratricopeptide (TPR) repeat protein